MFPGRQKSMFAFFLVSGTLPNFFLKTEKNEKNDKFEHCDVFTVHYLELVSIFRVKTFFGRLVCIIEQFNRNPQKFPERIAN